MSDQLFAKLDQLPEDKQCEFLALAIAKLRERLCAHLEESLNAQPQTAPAPTATGRRDAPTLDASEVVAQAEDILR